MEPPFRLPIDADVHIRQRLPTEACVHSRLRSTPEAGRHDGGPGARRHADASTKKHSWPNPWRVSLSPQRCKKGVEPFPDTLARGLTSDPLTVSRRSSWASRRIGLKQGLPPGRVVSHRLSDGCRSGQHVCGHRRTDGQFCGLRRMDMDGPNLLRMPPNWAPLSDRRGHTRMPPTQGHGTGLVWCPRVFHVKLRPPPVWNSGTSYGLHPSLGVRGI